MVCAYKNIKVPYGVIEMGINGNIEAMIEKPELPFLVNTGIYVVEPEVLNNLDCDVSIGFPEIIEREKGKGKKVSTCRPSKPEARQAIKDYLASTPGPDGNTVNVDL